MLNTSKALCLPANNDQTTHLMAPQALGHRVKPFVSLDVVRAGEVSTEDDDLMLSDSGTVIIIFLVSGEADFYDSTRKQGRLKKNDVLWILSGAGVSYSLTPKTQDCVMVKLRVALSPALELAPAQTACIDSKMVERDGPAQILLGHYGQAQSRFAAPALLNYLVVNLSAGQEWAYNIPVNHRIAWVASISGEIKAGNMLISSNEITVCESSNKSIRFLAEQDCVFLLGTSQEYTHDLTFERFSKSSLREVFNKQSFESSTRFVSL